MAAIVVPVVVDVQVVPEFTAKETAAPQSLFAGGVGGAVHVLDIVNVPVVVEDVL